VKKDYISFLNNDEDDDDYVRFEDTDLSRD